MSELLIVRRTRLLMLSKGAEQFHYYFFLALVFLVMLIFESLITGFKRVLKLLYISTKNRGRLQVDISCNLELSDEFEGANKINARSSFYGSLGYGSYIGPDCRISARIGRFSSIAPFVRTTLGIHPYTTPFATTSPMFYSLKKQNGKTFANKLLFDEIKDLPNIGNDCWIGENVFIAGGVRIDDGAVVLSGAVVVDDIPPYAIFGGVPAKLIRFRYDEDTVKFLMEFKWWDKDLSWITNHWELMTDIEALKSYANSSIHRSDV